MIIIIRRGVLFLALGVLIVSITMVYAKTDSPSESFNHENAKKIIVDPGHGNPDGGAVSKNGTIESTINLQIAVKLSEKLKKQGFDVIMTRSDENGLDKRKRSDMNMRLDIMKNSSADMFISIHMNTFSQSKYKGAEVLYSDNFVESTLLAQLIMDRIKNIDPPNQTRSIQKASNSLFLMKNSTMPAVIVECGFLSNLEEESLLKNPDYQNKMAESICSGIMDYYKNKANFESEVRI